MNAIGNKFLSNGITKVDHLLSDDYAISKSFSASWICSLLSDNRLQFIGAH